MTMHKKLSPVQSLLKQANSFRYRHRYSPDCTVSSPSWWTFCSRFTRSQTQLEFRIRTSLWIFSVSLCNCRGLG